MPLGQQLRAQIASAIIDAAASVLNEQGDTASRADVAAAAGVGRATLYRYFGSRDDLMRALAVAALDDLASRFAGAELDKVSVPTAIERMTRAMLACGTKFAVVIDVHHHMDEAELERRIGEPLRGVLRRGIADGALRDDLPVDLLARMFGGLLKSVLRSPDQLKAGLEQASAAISSVFLRGVAREGAHRRAS
jgi:TetR/AcrR family transcriptional repressor of mexCD-oprJ operon